MLQRVLIVKIGGDSGIAIMSRFREWANARITDDPDQWEADQWSVAVRHEINSFVTTLRANGHQPPVVFYNEHVDMWSMANAFVDLFPVGIEQSLKNIPEWINRLPTSPPKPDNGQSRGYQDML